MSQLKVYPDSSEKPTQVDNDYEAIAKTLSAAGMRFERWQAEAALTPDADQDAVLNAYRKSVDRLMTERGYITADVINMKPDHPDKRALRQKFLSEHVHSDDEVRFFVQGKGLFCIHTQDKVFAMLCESGDLISVPANTPHWFDMGDTPDFTCIRLFNDPSGWVANYTGDDIAERYPRFGE